MHAMDLGFPQDVNFHLEVGRLLIHLLNHHSYSAQPRQLPGGANQKQVE